MASRKPVCLPPACPLVAPEPGKDFGKALGLAWEALGFSLEIPCAFDPPRELRGRAPGPDPACIPVRSTAVAASGAMPSHRHWALPPPCGDLVGEGSKGGRCARISSFAVGGTDHSAKHAEISDRVEPAFLVGLRARFQRGLDRGLFRGGARDRVPAAVLAPGEARHSAP